MNTQKLQTHLIHGIHYFIVIALLTSGVLKLIQFPPYYAMIMDLSPGYAQHIHILGIIAIVSAILLAIPKTFAYGFIATLVFLGGTIAAHMQHGDPYFPQILFVLLIATVARLKYKAWFHI